PMGWLKTNGYRRFRRKYKSVARQNGKTFENGITGAYIAGFYGYRYGKLFTVATDKRQARLAWEKMANFILADDDLSEYFVIKDYVSYIRAENTGCTIEALSKEAGLKEGFASIFASVDEIHQHRDNSIYKAMYNGQRALKEALISMITTRGKDINSFCYEFDRYCLAVLAGSTADDLFADIYSLDEHDNIYDPACFLKTNPVLCATEHGVEIQISDSQTAREMGGDDLADYMVKCQNMWLENSDKQFVAAVILEKCRIDVGLEQFRNRPAYVGLDLSHGGDLTTLALEFEDDKNGYYAWSLSFMPRGRLIEHLKSDLAPYDLWEQMGLLLVTGGESDFKNNYAFIISELRRIKSEFNITFLGIGYDPHNADGFLQDLEKFGAPLLEITQSAKFLNDGTVDVQLLMKSGLYHYDKKNELLDLSFRNAKTVKNSFGEKKVDKNPLARTKRIDPVDAAIDAHVARMKLSGETVFDANAAMEAYLIKMGLMEGKKDEKKA
ncbi:MAG: terminase TerL endonuclease subunit, partial [Oscillospiraceae bacterium]